MIYRYHLLVTLHLYQFFIYIEKFLKINKALYIFIKCKIIKYFLAEYDKVTKYDKVDFSEKNVYNFSKVKNYFNFFSKDSWYIFQVYANEIDEKTYERKRHHWRTSFIGERKDKQKKTIYQLSFSENSHNLLVMPYQHNTKANDKKNMSTLVSMYSEYRIYQIYHL